ncbi:DUF1661 domain-containing protein [Porphyromonas gulae]|uniref:DUF1661 domain-containing protein n=1 Tax=Porphyromonas gulae TaxID=111105 RepID=UPI0012D30B6E|nr:DUF1661 domain-containing protein [Porphyromonas gulae]
MAREAKNSRTKTEKKSRAFFKKHVRKISGFWLLKSLSSSLHQTKSPAKYTFKALGIRP